MLTLREQVWEKYAETAKLLLKEGVDSKGDLAFPAPPLHDNSHTSVVPQVNQLAV